MNKLLGVPIIAVILALVSIDTAKPDGAVRHVTDAVPLAATRADIPP